MSKAWVIWEISSPLPKGGFIRMRSYSPVTSKQLKAMTLNPFNWRICRSSACSSQTSKFTCTDSRIASVIDPLPALGSQTLIENLGLKPRRRTTALLLNMSIVYEIYAKM
ncbi:hypothetical protein B1L04_05645 [Microcystis aeruginosa KW]|uniref:Uncharacterized protein n=1 Tax=Microcystis aeruginosa KW TaxID=1960155 RepID=A0A1V4BWQ3_MICAE|nr:hypothetical protein B1L04_05645 [Microcystis aeruginosa KW]